MLQIKFNRNFRFDPYKVNRTIYAIFLRFKDRGLKYFKKYPPQKNPDSKYERGFGIRPNQKISEDLGARWNADIVYGSGFVRIDFGNNASYAPFVHAEGMQAEIHQNWWQTDSQMIDLFLPQLENDFVNFLPSAIVSSK